MRLYQQTYQVLLLVDAPKIHTDVLWDLTFLFGGIALVYFTAIFFFRNKISGKSAKTSALKKELSPIISEFIFYNETGTKEEKSLYINLKVKVRDMLKDDFRRKTISEILLELRKDVSGAAQQRLFELFQDLDLHKDSYKKLKSWRWEIISAGIQELTRMEVTDAYYFLTKFVNDKRTTIRKQSEIAVVTLNSEGINYFMDTTRNRISEWQQLKLIEVLSNKTDFIPPSFKAWLVSKNKYVVLFALRLIRYFDQNDANRSIIELVKHGDNQIKQEAIDCIKAFHLTTSVPIIRQLFWNCSIDIKIAMLDVIGSLGTPDDIPFLESIEKKERNYTVTSKALGAINAIIPDSVLPTEGIVAFSTVIPEDIISEDIATDEVPHSTMQKTEEAFEEIVISDKIIKNSVKEEGKVDEVAAEEPKSAPFPEKIEDIGIDAAGVDTTIIEPTENSALEMKPIEVEFSTDFLPLVTKPEHKKNEIQLPMEVELTNIEVIYEEVYRKYEPVANSSKVIDVKKIEVITDVSFLPLVVLDEIEKPTKDYKELEVVFETVTVDSKTEETTVEKNIEEIDVSYEAVTTAVLEKENSLENINVIYEEVSPEKVERSFEEEDHLSEQFDFEIHFDNGELPLHIPKVKATEDYEVDVPVSTIMTEQAIVSEIEVVCEIEEGDGENKGEDLPDWLLNEIANEKANFNNREHLKIEGPEWEAKESQMMDQIKDYMKNIPTSGHTNDDVADTMQLLDDLALFGDEREIQLLQELMQKEDKAETRERIDGLMRRFMGTDVYGKGPHSTLPYSVFEELFRNCDTESKLILLDEIVLVGDEKEIRFLEQLRQDPNEKIRKKAAYSLKLLNERFERIAIGQESKDADEYERFINMMDLKPPKIASEPSYFQIDFEIDSEKEEEEVKEFASDGKGFLKFITDFISKLTK